jgi:hypothetical protein
MTVGRFEERRVSARDINKTGARQNRKLRRVAPLEANIRATATPAPQGGATSAAGRAGPP